MLSKDLEKSLNGVAQEASIKRHEFVTVEHLLLALLANDQAVNVLVNVGADVDALRGEVEKYIDDTTPTLETGDDERGTQTTCFNVWYLERYSMSNHPAERSDRCECFSGDFQRARKSGGILPKLWRIAL